MIIGVRLNMLKSIDKNILARLTAAFADGGAQVVSDAPSCEDFGARGAYGGDLYRLSDVIIAFGGDGTLLGAARSAAPYQKPVLGINFGRLGFLTEVEPSAMEDVASSILAGKYSLEKRMMLKGTLPDGRVCHALNDIIISRGYAMAMLYSQVRIDGELCDAFGGDGVVVSTATGSTAYCLSCGGPVISPKLRCMVVAPICSHSLRSRPIVIDPDEKVSVTVAEGGKSARVDADGVFSSILKPGACVTIEKDELEARFIHLADRNFYALLRNKLGE